MIYLSVQLLILHRFPKFGFSRLGDALDTEKTSRKLLITG